MFNNVAVDVFIGLIAVYLLYSLFASILMEVLAKYFALRARITLKAISKLLDDSEFTDDAFLIRVSQSVSKPKFFKPFNNRPLTALFYAHPNIKNLGRNNFERKPADISPEMFSGTLLQLLRGEKLIEGGNVIRHIKDNTLTATTATIDLPSWYTNAANKFQIKAIPAAQITINPLTAYQLKQMIMDSGEDVDLFKKALQFWFNEMMNRANGWYTKQTRGILFLVGFAIAIAFNVDTVAISQRLSTDKGARDGMLQFASKINEANTGSKGESPTAQDAAEKAFKAAASNMDEAKEIFSTRERSCKNFFGWLITAIAISLGAPFWFDLLGKFMTIAQAGKSSSTKTIDKTEDDAVG
jgi:hypothetical protein